MQSRETVSNLWLWNEKDEVSLFWWTHLLLLLLLLFATIFTMETYPDTWPIQKIFCIFQVVLFSPHNDRYDEAIQILHQKTVKSKVDDIGCWVIQRKVGTWKLAANEFFNFFSPVKKFSFFPIQQISDEFQKELVLFRGLPMSF